MYSFYFFTFDGFLTVFNEILNYVRMSFSLFWGFLWGIIPFRLLSFGVIAFFVVYFFVNLINRSKVD